MFDHTHYVPVLQARRAELASLRELSDEQKANLTPLFELPYLPWINPEDIADGQDIDDVRAINLAAMLDGTVERLRTHWSAATRRCFVDSYYAELAGLPNSGLHALEHFLNTARANSLLVAPVTGIERDPAQRQVVRNAVAQDGLGVCVRVTTVQLGDMDSLNSRLDGLLTELQIGPSDADLVVDFGAIRPESEAVLSAALGPILTDLRHLMEWRSLTLVASAFPQDLSGVSANSEATFPRTEWTVWWGLVSRNHRPERIPTFGDYAIDHPERPEPGPFWEYTISPQIRYATDDYWLVMKGKRWRDDIPWRFPDICSRVVQRSEFSGAAFSWGDQQIDQASRDDSQRGNPESWRRVGFSHHLSFALEQIATHPVP